MTLVEISIDESDARLPGWSGPPRSWAQLRETMAEDRRAQYRKHVACPATGSIPSGASGPRRARQRCLEIMEKAFHAWPTSRASGQSSWRAMTVYFEEGS